MRKTTIVTGAVLGSAVLVVLGYGLGYGVCWQKSAVQSSEWEIRQYEQQLKYGHFSNHILEQLLVAERDKLSNFSRSPVQVMFPLPGDQMFVVSKHGLMLWHADGASGTDCWGPLFLAGCLIGLPLLAIRVFRRWRGEVAGGMATSSCNSSNYVHTGKVDARGDRQDHDG